jgi:hypothetical protein
MACIQTPTRNFDSGTLPYWIAYVYPFWIHRDRFISSNLFGILGLLISIFRLNQELKFRIIYEMRWKESLSKQKLRKGNECISFTG